MQLKDGILGSTRSELKLSVYYKIAQQVSRLSTCTSKQVGCVIISQYGRPVSWGYNGTLPGEAHCIDIFDSSQPDYDRSKHSEWSKLHEIHAEVNAIRNAKHIGSGDLLNGSIAICTLEPCIECTKTLLLYGVKNIYYINAYDLSSIEERNKKQNLIESVGAKFGQINTDGKVVELL